MLDYTGHPLVDVGVATLAAFAGKRDPTQLTEPDLDRVAEYLATEYVRQPLKSFLTVAFPNSGFTQPAYERQPEKRRMYADRVLHAYRPGTPKLSQMCVFTGQPAVAVPFDVKGELPPGRTYRQHIPLLTGEDVINFFPSGVSGLAVSGEALLALQALPMGCAKCGGRLLAVHSDNSALTYHFAATFLEANRRAIQLAQAEGSTKMPETQFSHRTLLIDVLLRADILQREAREDRSAFSLTAYHFSNSGQGVGLDIYHLPLQVVGFLRHMYSADLVRQWEPLVQRAWEIAPRDKKPDPNFQPHRNWLYEDLFGLPQNARRFLRTYFLRVALRYARGKNDPRVEYSLNREAALVSWAITASFLRRVVYMDEGRIEQIRKLGDALAEYVSSQNDRRFFRDFYVQQRYSYLRNTLIKANLAHVRRGNPPLITLDPYIEVFEEGDGLAQVNWQLARDLVLIRMVEQLYNNGWFSVNADVLEDAESTDEESATDD